MKFGPRIAPLPAVAFLSFLMLSGTALAQDTPAKPADNPPAAASPNATPAPPQNPPQTPAATPAPASTPASTQEPAKAENSKRIGGIVPNFITTNQDEHNAIPMTTKEKYTLAYHQFFDVSAHVGNAFQASLQQAFNGQPHYGEGWGAYAERFGAAEGDQVTSSLLIYGFLPTVFHDDPRYFRRGKGSVGSRILYAASRTIITRTDSGHATFNFPQVLGQLGQGAISTAYYPQQDRSAGAVFHNWGINLAYTSAYITLREFYPDLMRVFHHKHDQAPAN